MFEAVINERGFPTAKCSCDMCGRETLEKAQHTRHRGDENKREVVEKQVITRLRGKGWTHIKNVLRCPACEIARKEKEPKIVESENAMTDKLKTLKLVTPATEPSREQKRQIMGLLDSVYDTSKGRYTGVETDTSVAAALGDGFMVDWIGQIREEFFGPDGNDSAMLELAAEMAELRAEIDKAFERSAEAHKAITTLSERLDKATSRLDHLTGVRK